jgi:hypothetical protein
MIKFRAPPTFSGKQGEGSAEWLELYESTAEYNKWGETEKRANFGMHLDGPARKGFSGFSVSTHRHWGWIQQQFRGLEVHERLRRSTAYGWCF